MKIGHRRVGAWMLAGAALASVGCGSSKNNGAGPSPEAGSGSGSGSASGAASGSGSGSGTSSGSTSGASGSGSSTGAGSGAGTGASGASGATQEGGTDAGEGGAPQACVPFDAGTLDDAAVAAGFTFIENVGHCYRCHQTNPDAGVTLAGLVLSGNMNSISDASPVYPPNLTSDPGTGLGCWNNDQIANAILFGVDPEADGGHLCSVMPKFGVGRGDAAPALDDASVYNVVALLRSLPVVQYQAMQTVCPMTGAPASDAGDAGDAGAPPPDSGDAASE